MRYFKQLLSITSDKRNRANTRNRKSITLFLVNESVNQNTDHTNGQSFEFYFHLQPEDDFEIAGALSLGLYNGTFGRMDHTLSPNSFTRLNYLEQALSNQLAVYLIQELIHFPQEDKMYLEHMALSLGDYLVKLYCQHEKLCTSLKMGISPFQVKLVNNFILSNIERSISTKDLAQVVGLSVHHFIRMFKRTTGETPHQCVNRIKMEHAKTLLLDTTDSIIQVGMSVGCDNPSHFSQLFKSSFGISPLRFRRAFRNHVPMAQLK